MYYLDVDVDNATVSILTETKEGALECNPGHMAVEMLTTSSAIYRFVLSPDASRVEVLRMANFTRGFLYMTPEEGLTKLREERKVSKR